MWRKLEKEELFRCNGGDIGNGGSLFEWLFEKIFGK